MMRNAFRFVNALDVHERSRDLVCTLREVDHSRRKSRRCASTVATPVTRADGGTKVKGYQYTADAYTAGTHLMASVSSVVPSPLAP